MEVIELDANDWKQIPDFYDALFRVLGAPAWHGRSPVALVDSMVGGGGKDINALKPPYDINIVNISQLPNSVKEEMHKASYLIRSTRERRLARTGEDVKVRLQVADTES
jgi:hypothetical protein